MEGFAAVEVFARNDATFDLVVEPQVAVSALKQHLIGQPHEVAIVDEVVGDVEVRLLNGKSLEAVLGPQIHITEQY